MSNGTQKQDCNKSWRDKLSEHYDKQLSIVPNTTGVVGVAPVAWWKAPINTEQIKQLDKEEHLK